MEVFMFEKGNTFGSANKGREQTEKQLSALLEYNHSRLGQPRSEAGKLASQEACKKMNLVRHLKARHILENVDPIALTGDCRTCGKVPIKVMKHRANDALRDQYMCWVGTLNRKDRVWADAVVSYPNHALEMWDRQQGNCALCDKPMERGGNTTLGTTLDHCHVTGRLRGFLHQGCNKGLGHFLDDPEVLKKSAEYLLRQS
jgi:hypothetical protein